MKTESVFGSDEGTWRDYTETIVKAFLNADRRFNVL
jgi:hypothetical protein